MSKKTITPIDVRTDKQLCSLLRPGKTIGAYAIELYGSEGTACEVTIVTPTGEVTIPKFLFNKMARWYTSQQACRD